MKVRVWFDINQSFSKTVLSIRANHFIYAQSPNLQLVTASKNPTALDIQVIFPSLFTWVVFGNRLLHMINQIPPISPSKAPKATK
jgi:hypothetical protein